MLGSAAPSFAPPRQMPGRASKDPVEDADLGSVIATYPAPPDPETGEEMFVEVVRCPVRWKGGVPHDAIHINMPVVSRTQAAGC